MTATISTRKTTISERKVCQEGGNAYAATWIGTRVVFTDWEGVRHTGTIARFENGYPVAELDNGQWARLDYQIEIITGE